MTTSLARVDTTLLIIFYALAIYNVIKILHEEMNPTAATAWILVNLSFPFIGVPLYFFLGQNKIKGYSKRRRRTRSKGSPQLVAAELEHMFKLDQGEENNSVSRNNIDVLDDGEKAFEAIFDAISKAESFVLVQYYIFRPDRLGKRFKELLIERSKLGVKVFFIFDNLGSLGMTGRYERDLRRAGIQVARFLPFQFRFHLQVNFRNHRKLVVVDGQVAFVGGMNVGSEYLGRKKFWRDTQLQIRGPAIAKLMDTFIDDWNFAVRGSRRNLPTKIIDRVLPQPEGKLPASAISFGPGDEIAIGLYMFMQLIQTAKSSLVIATPYYIPDTVLERCLELALLRGVQITLIVPKKPDHWYMKPISFIGIRRLAKLGGKVYLYQKGFMHQKVMLVDEKFAMIGTSNFDNRSIYLNFETCLLIDDADFGQRINQMLQRDIQDSKELNLKDDESRGYLFVANLARLLAPLF